MEVRRPASGIAFFVSLKRSVKTRDDIARILAMEEGQKTLSDGCAGSWNNQTGRTTSSGFIGPMSAVLVLDLLVVVGNSLVVTAVFTHAKLRRSTTNRFIVSLAVADLMVGLLVLPFSSANEVGYNYSYN